ncbi:MAG: ABC transporter ATP-binding protein [Dehalococcoidia bacterium]|nr:MAG: ABC transporter ATP-binding protein [Dehalococcoidia bacterium]
MTSSSSPILTIDGLHAYYGTAHVLFDITLEVPTGATVALLGRNGAGKSTLLKSVMRLDVQTRGAITFKGERIDGLAAYQVARRGIGFVPGDRRIYPDLSVRENLNLARHSLNGRTPLSIDQILRTFPTLGPLLERRGSALSGGEQQLLAIARALISNPDLLLLDEPSEGLAPVIVQRVAQAIADLKSTHAKSILLAEQNARFAVGLADQVLIIDEGRIVFRGSPEEFRAAEEIQSRYLAV